MGVGARLIRSWGWGPLSDRYGIAPPFTPNPLRTTFWTHPPDESALMEAVYLHGPVAVLMNAARVPFKVRTRRPPLTCLPPCLRLAGMGMSCASPLRSPAAVLLRGRLPQRGVRRGGQWGGTGPGGGGCGLGRIPSASSRLLLAPQVLIYIADRAPVLVTWFVVLQNTSSCRLPAPPPVNAAPLAPPLPPVHPAGP